MKEEQSKEKVVNQNLQGAQEDRVVFFQAWQKFLSVLLLIIVFTILGLAKLIAKMYPCL